MITLPLNFVSSQTDDYVARVYCYFNADALYEVWLYETFVQDIIINPTSIIVNNAQNGNIKQCVLDNHLITVPPYASIFLDLTKSNSRLLLQSHNAAVNSDVAYIDIFAEPKNKRVVRGNITSIGNTR